MDALQEEGVARAPIACQTLFKVSSNRRFFPILALTLLKTPQHGTADGFSRLQGRNLRFPQTEASLSLQTIVEEKLAQGALSAMYDPDRICIGLFPA
jgi:hypothetical protein